MYRMITSGTTRPRRDSGRRRVVCPLMAAAATLEAPTAKMARPHAVLSTRLIFLKIGEDHSACGTDSRANCSVNGMNGISAKMISPKMMPTPAPPQVASQRAGVEDLRRPDRVAGQDGNKRDCRRSQPGDADVAVRQEPGKQREDNQGQEGEDERQ
jgi:hypothetical protein